MRGRLSLITMLAIISILSPIAPWRAAHALERNEQGSPAGGKLAEVRYIYHGLAVQPPSHAVERGVPKQPLFNQYFLRTAANQKASISFADGTAIHLNQQTDIVLASPHLTQVKKGEIAEYLAPGTSHQVQSGTAVAAAIGTTFDVRLENNVAYFVVLHGALDIDSAGVGVVVKSNHQTTVPVAHAPEAPTPVNALAAFDWTRGIPTPDLGEDISLDANGGTIQGFSSQRTGAGDKGHVQHINDGLLDQGWETAEGKVSNQFVKIGFLGGNPYRISGVIIDPAATYGDPASEDLKGFQIKVSSSDTKDSSFTTIFQGTCQQKDALQHFILPVPVRAKYIELVALDNYGSPHRIAVAEWEVVANESLFAQPSGIAVDGQGNLYVVDTNSNRVQKVSPAGKIIAQWGSKGHGLGQFLRPEAIALDRQGNIYVADTFNNRIEKLSPKGHPLTQFGSSGIGSGQFLFPSGIAVDSGGNMYVTDVVGRVQKLSPSGKVLGVWTNAGSGGALNFPEGITIDNAGNILVADTDNNRIVKFSASGTPLATFGSAGSDAGQFDQPTGVSVDRQGNIYVVDSFNDRVQKLNPTATKAVTWGKSGTGPGQFLIPRDVTVDSRGNVYVTDRGNSRIEKFSTTGKLRAVWGKYASIPQVLGEPSGIAADAAGNLYVADELNDRIQERSPQGNVRAVIGHHGYVALEHTRGLGQFWYPHGVAIDQRGAIYVADTFNSRIQVLAPRGPIGTIGSKGTAPGQMLIPEGVAVDTHGNLYVADTGNNRVQKLTSKGKVIWSVGTAGTGPGQFQFPEGIAVDHEGNVYVSDYLGQRVQKLSPDGKVLAVWGTAQVGTARFFAPEGLAVDAHDDVYVADSGHGVIQKLSPDGTLLDEFEIPGPNASPAAVTISPSGDLYVTDDTNSRIIKLAPTGEVLAIWY